MGMKIEENQPWGVLIIDDDLPGQSWGKHRDVPDPNASVGYAHHRTLSDLRLNFRPNLFYEKRQIRAF
jgi:hypothetical protein